MAHLYVVPTCASCGAKNIAIYHASFQIVKRSAGRSAVAAIAYRSGERLVDERTGEIHDYSRKRGVDETFIMAPDDAPDWASDRAALWSAVELGEKRKDAQLARELNVALPRELSKSESAFLIKAYVQDAFIDKGMVADVALHELDSDNPHAHIMLTLRSIDADGFGQKNRDWNAKPLLQEWREQWAHTTNAILKQAGHEVRIDHRSLEEQGVERTPTVHLGVHAHQMEQRGVTTLKGDLNRRIAKINAALEAVGLAIEKQVNAIKQAVPSTADVRDSILDTVNKHGSILQQAVDRKEAEQVRERTRKQEERALKRPGPSLEH